MQFVMFWLNSPLQNKPSIDLKMKTSFYPLLLLFILTSIAISSSVPAPTGCRPVLGGVPIDSLTKESLTNWCDVTPMVIQCDDGVKYTLKTFKVNFFTMKPLMNREFGIGEGGMPIKAREAVAAGSVGDALVLKEVSATGPKGEPVSFSALSFKIK